MKDFTRIAYASDKLQAIWEPRINRIAKRWRQVEIDSVRVGIRDAALVYKTDDLDTRGVQLTPVSEDRFVVTKDLHLANAFVKDYSERYDSRIGEYLGFPLCCRTFFDRVWNVEQKKDTTLSMESGYSVAGNILGRWIGVRLVPHLPCSFGCVDTNLFSNNLSLLWTGDEWKWANEILSWPVEYTALHGIAEIKFPILKIVTNTDYTKTKLSVRLQGTVYPEGAPKGLVFPFQEPNHFVSFSSLKPKTNDTWTANGFPSLESMRQAHGMVKSKIPTTVKSVLDIGSGNGMLLKSIEEKFQCSVLGLEADQSKAEHAMVTSIHGLAANVDKHIHDIFDLVIISQNRFNEMTIDQRIKFAAWAADHTRDLLVYSYDQPQYARLW